MIIVVIKERSAGNAETGSAWLETALFDDSAPLSTVLEWAGQQESSGPTKYGRLMLSVPERQQ